MNSKNNPIICDISDRTFDTSSTLDSLDNYRVRKAARGVLINEGKIALLNVNTKGYHKLPGGGVEENETNDEAFIREILEETGCKSKVIENVGVTIEYRNQLKLVQISYVFTAEVIGEPGLQKLEQGEIDEGHDLEWYSIDEALSILQNEHPLEYEGKFINTRDKSILQHYRTN